MLERLITHLSQLVGAGVVGGATILVAVEEVVTAEVVGTLAAVGAVSAVMGRCCSMGLDAGTDICCIYCMNFTCTCTCTCTWWGTLPKNC